MKKVMNSALSRRRAISHKACPAVHEARGGGVKHAQPLPKSCTHSAGAPGRFGSHQHHTRTRMGRGRSMSLSLVQSRALVGLQAAAVTVEVHLANGLPSFTLVGLADIEVKEARERVRSALQNCGLEFPHNKRITVNLAPADLPKDSGRFDLPIALGILAASGQIDARKLEGYEFAGELSLGGDLRPIRGALAMSLALAHGKGEKGKKGAG